ncbi:ATP-binding protein [Streptomyces sp. NPDC006140]|uniref:ATP-binding protein n=1 Tax=Streptomyces sp. NPDC006140 TaxID=3154579 RepID=UPI0033CA71E1
MANSNAVEQWITRLLSVLADGLKCTQQTMDQVQRGERPQLRELPLKPDERNRFAVLEYELHRFVREAQLLISGASAQQEKRAHLTLGRRMLMLLNQMLRAFDELEREIEDPVVLRPLWHLDHMATRARRFAESIAVVGGAVPRRSDKPTSLSDVINHAIAEVEQYARVKLASPVEGTIRGRAAAGLIHSLAELIDNATNFSAPDTQVAVRVVKLPAGIAIEIDDHGEQIPDEFRDQLNGLLADVSRPTVGEFVRDGRIGMWVVATHARRIGFQVRLQTNIYLGNQAVVVIPFALFHSSTTDNGQDEQPAPAPVRRDLETPRPPLTGGRIRPGSDTRLPDGPRPAGAALPTSAADAERLPPLPQRRTGATQAFQPGRTSSTSSGSESPQPLTVRDTSRSYLAEGLRRRPSRAVPTNAPDSRLMAQIAAGRRRAAQQGASGSHPSPKPSESPHALEASHEARNPDE